MHQMHQKQSIDMRQVDETIITAQSLARNPGSLAVTMIKDVLSSRELARQLMMRNLRATYRQSLLGILWAFIPPVAIALAFALMGKAKVVSFGTTEIPYPAYVILGMVIWQTFVEAVMGPLNAVGEYRPMMAKIRFPREAIIIAKLGEVIFNFLLKIVLIIAVLAWYRLVPGKGALLTPLAIMAVLAFGTFLGVLLAPLSLLYKDISKGMPVIFLFWLLCTPVVIPVPREGVLAHIVSANPMAPLIVVTRDLLTGVEPTSLGSLLLVGVLSVIGCFAAWIVFRLAMPFVVERMSA